jgi:hypothetical protein
MVRARRCARKTWGIIVADLVLTLLATGVAEA